MKQIVLYIKSMHFITNMKLKICINYILNSKIIFLYNKKVSIEMTVFVKLKKKLIN